MYIGGDTNVLTELRAVTSQRRKYVIEGGFLPFRINMILNYMLNLIMPFKLYNETFPARNNREERNKIECLVKSYEK